MPVSTADYVRTTIDRTQARSVVTSTGGIVAAENPLASQAGAVVLARGGHAVDAAIAANAVMGVVAPMMNGIGGDLFAIVYDAATEQLHGLNAQRLVAGRSCRSTVLTPRGMSTMPQQGIHAVTVPGAVSGWMALHGEDSAAPLGRSARAGDCARRGRISRLGDHRARMARQPKRCCGADAERGANVSAGRAARRKPARSSATRIWRDLLRAIAARTARDAFYRGEIARRILECSDDAAARCHAADLSEYQAEWVDAADDQLPRVGGLRDPAEQPGHRGADHAEHPREFPLGDVRPRHRRGAAHADRSEEAGLCRHAAPRRRSPLLRRCRSRRCCRRPTRASARRASSIRAAPPPTSAAGTLPMHGGDTTYLCVGRSRRQHGLAHSKQLRQLRIRRRSRRRRIRAAEPRRPVHVRSRRIPMRWRRASGRCRP